MSNKKDVVLCKMWVRNEELGSWEGGCLIEVNGWEGAYYEKLFGKIRSCKIHSNYLVTSAFQAFPFTLIRNVCMPKWLTIFFILSKSFPIIKRASHFRISAT